VDGTLERESQVFTLPKTKRLALVSPALPDVVVLDTEAKKVFTAEKAAFRVSPDRATATTDDELRLAELCTCTIVDPATFLVQFDGHAILIGRHQGLSGAIDEAKIFETVPVWKALMDACTPSPDAVAALAAVSDETELTVVLGTWCGDSKSQVPRLIRALRAAANPKLRPKFVGVASGFLGPRDTLQEKRVVNVPTVIVERGGCELGRFVESPGGASVEDDIVAILNGHPNEQPRPFRKAGLLASGAYRTLEGDSAKGREYWELYRTKENGLLVHSRVYPETGADVEVWEEVDAAQRPHLVEITRRAGAGLSRARYWLDGEKLTGHARGSDAGVMDQTLGVPAKVAFQSPAAASRGFGADVPAAYVANEDFAGRLGVLCTERCEEKELETVSVPAGEFRARRIVRSGENGTSEWWIHPDLGIPVKGRQNGRDVVLVSLTLAPPAP
jgi:hypothetical protein